MYVCMMYTFASCENYSYYFCLSTKLISQFTITHFNALLSINSHYILMQNYIKNQQQTFNIEISSLFDWLMIEAEPSWGSTVLRCCPVPTHHKYSKIARKKSITITHNNWNSPRVFIYWTCCSNKTYMYFFVCVKFTKNGEGDFWIQWMFFWKLENWYIILSLYRHIFSNLTMNSPCTDNRIFTRSTDLILDNCQMIMMKTSSFLEWRMYILFAHARMTARRN